MTATEPLSTPQFATERAQPGTSRFASVDALRGVVMFVMLYVNDVAGVPGIPWWMKHFDETGSNGMTFVDWVFGGFLFVVGFSIPLAFKSRLARGDSRLRLLWHVLTRTAGLLILGVLMVNGETGPDKIGFSRQLWHVLLFASGILAFLSTPQGASQVTRRAYVVLRLIGFATLGFLAFVYRDKDGHVLQPQWWGILGLIGWAYLSASLGYLILRRREFLAAATFLLIALFMFDHTGFLDKKWAAAHLPWLHWLHKSINFGEMFGAHGAIAMAGVFLGATLIDPAIASPQERIRIAVMWGFLLATAAVFFYPFYLINKNNATPTWCLICASATSFLWALLSLVMDVGHVRRPIGLFIRGGQNVLLAYLFMPMLIHFIWWRGWGFYGAIGHYSVATGISRSLVMAALVLGLAGVGKDRGVRLRL